MISEESRRNYSQASIARQAATPPEVRLARMRIAAKARWANVSPEDRRAFALKMVAARGLNKQTDVKIEERSEGRDLQSVVGADSASADGSVIGTGVTDIAKLV